LLSIFVVVKLLRTNLIFKEEFIPSHLTFFYDYAAHGCENEFIPLMNSALARKNKAEPKIENKFHKRI